jgi:hypothetical protein
MAPLAAESALSRAFSGTGPAIGGLTKPIDSALPPFMAHTKALLSLARRVT